MQRSCARKYRIEPDEEEGKNEVVELHYDFQKAYDNVNNDYLYELMDVYGFPIGVQCLIIEMSMRKILLSFGTKRGRGRGPPHKQHHPGRCLLATALCSHDRSSHQDHEEEKSW